MRLILKQHNDITIKENYITMSHISAYAKILNKTSHGSFTDWNKFTIPLQDIDNRRGYACMWMGICRNSSDFVFNFTVNLKLL